MEAINLQRQPRLLAKLCVLSILIMPVGITNEFLKQIADTHTRHSEDFFLSQNLLFN